jgi:hypothetical protein
MQASAPSIPQTLAEGKAVEYTACMNTQTFSILGDSISTFAGFVPDENELFYPHEGVDVTQAEHTWWYLLQERTGLKLLMNERYQYPRASPGLRRRCLLFRPKGRGISPCFPGTRSGEEPSC